MATLSQIDNELFRIRGVLELSKESGTANTYTVNTSHNFCLGFVEG